MRKQFQKSGEEKRTLVINSPELHDTWLSADAAQAAELMSWQHMPVLVAGLAPRT